MRKLRQEGEGARPCAGAGRKRTARERGEQWRGPAGLRRPSSSSSSKCCPGSRSGTIGFWPSCRRLSRRFPGLKQELFHRHKEAQQCCRPHNLPLLRAAQQREMEAMEQQIREEQRMMDEKIVLELDQKVIDQQSTLEKAGVSGFYITTNPQELTLQMNLLELIRKLQQKEAEAEKTFS
ncbi:PREDICTED: protein DGCR6 isoform X4 [Ficedula albicollis]|uniref:protein DGCR6 isoform X4 n=1 Tax=Ficedula albicollis TaxID=59894 RepID=UPI000359CE3B|nr:PREDICTED: protein DGCR6 isoform X4 [Ficedula albicollis]